MEIKRDQKNQPYIEWEQGPGAKRAWIRHADASTNWANTGRYLNVTRIKELGTGPAGNSTDFPVYCSLPDEEILIAFVVAVCGITGCKFPN